MDTLHQRHLTVLRYLSYRYYVSESRSSKAPLLLLHGWPDDAYVFSQILAHLQPLDRQIVIPDLLGYGNTSKPTDPLLYNMRSMCQDLCEIIDAEGIDKVIAIGHDWGSTLASRFCIFHASRCKGLVQISTPYSAPTDSFDLDNINAFTAKMTGYPRLSYVEFLTQPDAPKIWEQHLEAAWTTLHGSSSVDDPQRWMTTLFCQKDAMREFLLSNGERPLPPELKGYAKDSGLKSHWMEAMKFGGMEAPACWYRALVSNVHWEGEKKWAEETESQRREQESPWKLDLPVLYIGCTGDTVASTDLQRMAQKQGLLPDLKIEELESGHWCPYEKPGATARAIIEFLRSREL